jgi:tripartite-type tricarboxylate transporter receptor subunit TctC
MAAYKVPRMVEFVDALPKSGSGKVMWRLLFSRRSWFGMFGPKDLPREIVERLNTEIERIGRDPEVSRKLLALGLFPDFLPAAQFGPQVANDMAFFAGLLKQLDIKLDH